MTGTTHGDDLKIVSRHGQQITVRKTSTGIAFFPGQSGETPVVEFEDIGHLIEFLSSLPMAPPLATEAVRLAAPQSRIQVGIQTPDAVNDFLVGLLDHNLVPTFIGDPTMVGASIEADNDFEAGKIAGEIEHDLRVTITRAPHAS